MPENRKITTAYRYLTGPDDVTFCNRVTQALGMGWSLYGSPTMTYDSARGRVICGQALTKDIDEAEPQEDAKTPDP